MTEHVTIHKLTYAYPDGRVALDEVSLNVSAGERVALVGHNGAGKSTLLLHLNGILRGEGVLRIKGLEVTDANVRRIRASVGLVFQDPNDQLFSPTVFDDVAFGPLQMGLPQDEVMARTNTALAMVGMTDFASRMPHHLSLGERKRASIATVLSMEPSVLALDEPSAGLDPQARQELIALLRRLDHTMIIASHDLGLIEKVCSRAFVLSQGRLVADLTPEQLVEHSEMLYVRDQGSIHKTARQD